MIYTENNIESMNSYVYVYLDPRKPGNFSFEEYAFLQEPFYVGKGYGNRAYEHLNEKRVYNPFKHRKIKKIQKEGLEPVIVFVEKNVSDEEAINLEKKLINLIGRSDKKKGPLTNLTDGGDGTLGLLRSDESIQKQKKTLAENSNWKAAMKSKEFSEKMSEILKERYKDPNERKKQSKRLSGKNNPMYGKKGSQKQKDAVRKAHKEGKITLSEKGRQSLIQAGKKRKGTKNVNTRKDVKEYILFVKDKRYEVSGAINLQELCKELKLQYHVLKNNIGTTITKEMVKGTRIHAINTINAKLQNK